MAVAQSAFATFTVTNAKELASAAPDTSLGADLAAYFDESEIARATRRNNEINPAELVTLLVQLKSPDPLRMTQRRNEVIRVGPVEDFDAFMKAIDYGRVTGIDEANRRFRIKIDPEEIAPEKLLALARSTGRRPHGLEALTGESDRGWRSGDEDEEGISDGDRVRFDFGEKQVTATVVASGLSFDRVRVRLESPQDLAPRIKDRRLKHRLSRATEVELIVEEDRLEELNSRPASAGTMTIAQRTWTDSTGKHQIIATYGGVSGDRVRLSKPNGKESLVPLARLSEADQSYVRAMLKGANNPFSDLAEGGSAVDNGPKVLQPKFNSLRQVRGRDFSGWEFAPSASGSLPTARPASASVSFEKGKSTGARGEMLERLSVSADGTAAIGVRTWGITKETFMIQRLDLARGVAEPAVKAPRETVILDVDAATGLVLTRRDRFGHNKNTKLRVNRLSGGRLIPVAEWEPIPRDEFRRDVEEARWLGTDRLMVKALFGNWVVWDSSTATALCEIPMKQGSDFPLAADPSGRLLAIGATGAISLIDVERGRHVATVEHELGKVTAVALSADQTRLAAWSKKAGLAVWDLTTGQLLHEMAKPSNVRGDSLEVVGDLVLLGSRYLLDPSRGIVLWEYSVPGGRTSNGSGKIAFRAGRLWYAPESENTFPIYVGSIPWPHAPVEEALAELPSPEAMVAAQRGDTARVTIDTDRSAEERGQLLAAVKANLTKAGYRVVDTDDATIEATVYCRALSKRTLKINMSSHPFPDPWDIVEREIKPYSSSIVLKVGGREMWSEGWRADANHFIYIQDGESLDDALKRLTNPDVERLTQIEFPSRLARRGEATQTGAYGTTRLGPDG